MRIKTILPGWGVGIVAGLIGIMPANAQERGDSGKMILKDSTMARPDASPRLSTELWRFRPDRDAASRGSSQ